MTLLHAETEQSLPEPGRRPRLALLAPLGLVVACVGLGTTLGVLTGPSPSKAQLLGVSVPLPEPALAARGQVSEIATMAGDLEAIVSPHEPPIDYVLPTSGVLMTLAVSGAVGFRLRELAHGDRLALIGHPQILRLGVDQRYLSVRVVGYLIDAEGRHDLTAYIIPVNNAVVTLVCVSTKSVSSDPSALCSHLVGGLRLEPPLSVSVAASTLETYQSALASRLSDYAAKRDGLRARLASAGPHSAAKLASELASASKHAARSVTALAPISLTEASRKSVEHSLKELSGDYAALAHAIRGYKPIGIRGSEHAIEDDDRRLVRAIYPALEPLQSWAAQVSGTR